MTTWRARASLLAMILAVPVVGYGAAGIARATLDSSLRSQLLRQHPAARAEVAEGVRVTDLCGGVIPQDAPPCQRAARLDTLGRVSLVTAAVGLGLLVAIWAAGRAARTNRVLLARLFRPGLHATVLILIGLVIAHAGIAIASLYVLETALFNRVHGALIAVIAFGALTGIYRMATHSSRIVQDARPEVAGRAISRAEAPALWSEIERLARDIGTTPPDHVVLGLEPTFFVTEAEVDCFNGTLRGRTLYCAVPFCRILRRDELLAIVGHELAHFHGEDTEFSRRFYPIYRGTASAIDGLAEAASGHAARVISLLPALATLSFFFESFAVAENGVSRERELAADAMGARVTSARAAGSALVKAHAYAGVWQNFDELAVEAMRRGQRFANASVLFSESVAAHAAPSILEGIADDHLPHPTDSHPPLAVRLAALDQSLASLSAAALDVTPGDDAAATWIEGLERLEEELSASYQLLLARNTGMIAAEEAAA